MHVQCGFETLCCFVPRFDESQLLQLASSSPFLSHSSARMPSKAGGFRSVTAWQIIAVIILLYLAQLVLKAVYRITLHPLAKFPGPILATLTYKYEFYFDGIKGGQYLNEIARLH